MILLRRVLGDALRARRQAQHRTLREVSGAANVSLGYLSEVERGQKEASSELLAAICEALGAQLSDVLRDVSDTMELAELTESGVLTRGRGGLAFAADGGGDGGGVEFGAAPTIDTGAITNFVGDGKVSVAVRHEGPLKTTLRATRTPDQRREVVRAA
jgi:transcriptional regulator with XRE-family HTH domain